MTTTKAIEKDFFTSLPYWGELNKDEQGAVKQGTIGLYRGAAKVGSGQLEIAKSLVELHAALEGKGLFIKHLNTLDFSYRTGYRLKNAYQRAVGELGQPVVDAAMERGLPLLGFRAERPFGEYTEAVKALPAPPSDPAKVVGWVEKLEETKKDMPNPQKRAARRRRAADPAKALVEAYRGASRWYKALGTTGKARSTWAQQLLSYLMAEFGLPAQKIEPAAVPAGFRPQVGRPPKSSS